VSRDSWFDDDREQLVERLRALAGSEVACGVCPDFNVEDHAGLTSAAKGGIDGPR
jgi:hypothetical protein